MPGYIKIILLILVILLVFTGGEAGYWFFVIIVSIAAILCIVSIIVSIINYKKHKEKAAREFSLQLIARFMGLFFATGTLVTFFALPVIARNDGLEFNNIELVVRSMLYSLDLFILDLESSIVDRLDHDGGIKTLVVVQAFLSFTSSLSLLIVLIYEKASAYFSLHRKMYVDRQHNHLYLFFGVNEAARILAHDIRKKDKAAVIIFIDYSRVKDAGDEIWGSMVSLVTSNSSTFEEAKESGALVAVASREIFEVTTDGTGSDLDLLSAVGLSRIKKFIQRLGEVGGDLHVFFLSNVENNNIRNVISLSKDVTISRMVDRDKIHTRFYCRSQRDEFGDILENMTASRKIEVDIIDTSYLAIEVLKTDIENQPVKVANISERNPGTIENSIHALIIGFGPLGRRALHFLYEFGVFVGENSTHEKTEVLYPIITAVDADMDNIVGDLAVSLPGIDFKERGWTFIQSNYKDRILHERVLNEETLKKLNYVIIDIGEDKKNITLAITVLNKIRSVRSDLGSLIIMVRNHKEENSEMMQAMAERYNNAFENSKHNYKTIRLFGKETELFTYDLIVRDRLTAQAREFLNQYRGLKGEGNDWEKRRQKLIDNKNPIIDDLRKLRRQESQDLANAKHSATKIELLKKAIGGDKDLEEFSSRLFAGNGESTLKGKFTGICFPQLTEKENRVMLNLAMLEHLRWNASHELLGYVVNNEESKCDERRKAHNCLRPWGDLDRESEKASSADWQCDYKNYDFGVVETSILLWKNTRQNQ